MAKSIERGRVERLCLTDDQMKKAEYPHSYSYGTVIIPKSRYKHNQIPAANIRICAVCHMKINVFPDGRVIDRRECRYHPTPGKPGEIWKCCGKLPDGKRWEGCVMRDTHVHTGNLMTDNKGYVRFDKVAPSGDLKLFSLDTEMVYTKVGMEAGHLSVIDAEGDVVYKTVIQPSTAIVDYNTEFSGMTEKDFYGSGKKTLQQVHRDLQDLIFADTILVGHGLQNDFKALKIYHDRVIDTAVVFDHPQNPGHTPSLKLLAQHHLNRSIQKDYGHDSTEDAKTVMDLMLLKASSL